MMNRAELQDALRALDAAEKAEHEAQDKDRKEAWKVVVANPDNYEWNVNKSKVQKFFTDEVYDGLRVQKRLRPEAVEAFNNIYVHPVDGDKIKWFGMVYYRTDENIMTQDSGGTHVLREPVLCSDEEWAQIAAGNIPVKFLWRGKKNPI